MFNNQVWLAVALIGTFLTVFMLGLVAGTSNQSDYLSHYVANHMFFRLALPGARRILGDHIDFCTRHVPRWNPMPTALITAANVSVVASAAMEP